jgi:5-amino-6-(5-phosphoribosylamino)uracil reductase
VMCGARTVEISRSILGTGGKKFRELRLQRGLAKYNLRVIVSGSGSINQNAAIFKKHFSPVIILTTGRASKTKLRKLEAIADEVRVCGKREIRFATALRWLRTKWGVRRLLCEGGGELNDALFRADLVDELHLTICPRIFGGSEAPTIADGIGFGRLGKAAALQIKSFKRVGNEVFAVFVRKDHQ